MLHTIKQYFKFSGVHVTRSLVLHVCFVGRCLSFCTLCCLFFFDKRILITPLVSSNSSYCVCRFILRVFSINETDRYEMTNLKYCENALESSLLYYDIYIHVRIYMNEDIINEFYMTFLFDISISLTFTLIIYKYH